MFFQLSPQEKFLYAGIVLAFAGGLLMWIGLSRFNRHWDLHSRICEEHIMHVPIDPKDDEELNFLQSGGWLMIMAIQPLGGGIGMIMVAFVF